MHKLSTPTPTRVANLDIELNIHFQSQNLSDKIAYKFAKLLHFFADLFFANRYGHRAIALETVAAFPRMVGGLWQHMHSVRKIQDDKGWVRTLLDETKNERMHLMTFVEIAKPNFLERLIIMFVQAIFYNFYFFLYLLPQEQHIGFLDILKRLIQTISSFTKLRLVLWLLKFLQ